MKSTPRPPRTEVRFLDPRTDPHWQRLIARAPSLLFHSPAWLRVLRATYAFELQAAVVIAAGRAVAGLPFARVDDALGKRIVSLAFSDFCDPICERRSQATALLRALVRAYPDHPIKLRFVDAPAPAASLGFTAAASARWHGVRLLDSEDAQWQALHPQTRRAVLLAKKQGLAVRRLSKEELRGFFALHLSVRKYRYHLLAQPFRFFEAIWNELIESGAGFFLGAFAEDRLIAAHCLLPWQDRLVYKFGASDYRFPDARANHLLHWEAIEYGRREGFRLLDLGLSDDDQPGLIRYKRHLGAEEKVIRFYARPAGAPLPEAATFRAILGEVTRLATGPEVPDELTEKFGDLIYHYFA